eukprot:TRINITY_DN20733_c0_g1_i1.p1 TRINITY_DN20733_c0_g1~~TRINITY_DN20733_c0_g1_i1.p1  ORF type:complete len:506 (+),score=73.22 TRINITY_DN20733_c0_g1_i1:49-1518(+)
MSSMEELIAAVKKQGEILRIQQRCMATMMLEKFTGDGADELLDVFSEVVTPSVELMKGIDDAAADAEIAVFRKVHKLAKDKGSDNLRKGAARVLGSLMLTSDSKPEDIEFLSDDLPSVFSSTVYPRLLNEDEFFNKMESCYMYFGPHENGLPPDEKIELLLLLDLPILSDNRSRYVKRLLSLITWGTVVTDGWRMQNSVKPKRTYKYDPTVTLNADDLSDDVARSDIDVRFKNNPSTMCVIDVSGFLDKHGVFSRDVQLPPSVRHLLFTNGTRCRAIGDDFLMGCSNIRTVDLSCLQHVARIGNRFMVECTSLTNVHIPCEIKVLGSQFLSSCSSLEIANVFPLRKVTAIGDSFLAYCESLKVVSNISCLRDVKSIGNSFMSGCCSLASVDISCFTNVNKIGSLFLQGCKLLEALDFAALKNVTCLEGSFLSRCSSLKTISNISGLRNVVNVKKDFLLGCGSLEPINATTPGYELLGEELKKEFKGLRK